jgi:hypothetical protein
MLALKWLWGTTVEWVIALGGGLIYTAVACTLLGLVLMAFSTGFGWLTAPTEEARAAQAVKDAAAQVARKASLRQQAKPLFEKYRASCGAVPYPSTYCPAWYYVPGDVGEEKNYIIADGPDESLAEHPCFEGQIKARQTTGFYYEPGDEFYAAAQRSILCFDSAAEAEAQEYSHFED